MTRVIKKDTVLELDKEDINSLHKTIVSEIAFYEEVLAKFRKKYGDLVEFEAKLANAELPEHPYWEESIEYRNAYEELENSKRRQQRKTSTAARDTDNDGYTDIQEMLVGTDENNPCDLTRNAPRA